MTRLKSAVWLTAATLTLSMAQCGGSSDSTPQPVVEAHCSEPASASGSQPGISVHVQHTFLVVLENHGYSDVIGSPVMPYLNSLASTYASATQYFANTHPSLPNYFMLTAGETLVSKDGDPGVLTEDNIVRHLMMAGKTWKEYSEGLPSVGYTGPSSDSYDINHNPLQFFSDVRDNTSELQNLVPFTQFAADLSQHTLPDFSLMIPDDEHNGHNCPNGASDCSDDEKLKAMDGWLKANISPLIASSDFDTPGGGLLVITFDEAAPSDEHHGGGHIAWVAVGPDVKKGFTSDACYQHQSTLRFLAETIGLTSFPGEAGSAADMSEFLVTP